MLSDYSVCSPNEASVSTRLFLEQNDVNGYFRWNRDIFLTGQTEDMFSSDKAISVHAILSFGLEGKTARELNYMSAGFSW